jgi:hypothetical protein
MIDKRKHIRSGVGSKAVGNDFISRLLEQFEKETSE